MLHSTSRPARRLVTVAVLGAGIGLAGALPALADATTTPVTPGPTSTLQTSSAPGPASTPRPTSAPGAAGDAPTTAVTVPQPVSASGGSYAVPAGSSLPSADPTSWTWPAAAGAGVVLVVAGGIAATRRRE